MSLGDGESFQSYEPAPLKTDVCDYEAKLLQQLSVNSLYTRLKSAAGNPIAHGSEKQAVSRLLGDHELSPADLDGCLRLFFSASN
eukprot:gene14245-30315_t